MSDFLPAEFENRMRTLLGDEFDEFAASYDGERYRGLRINALKMNAEGRSASPDELELSAGYERIDWEPNGYYYNDADQPGKHPLHEAGVYYIQEPSAMAPVPMLRVMPGERVLDLCAAPGGKSTQLASALKGKGLLVTNEINPSRARILSENIERMGVPNAVVTNEAPAKLVPRFEGFFDKILVDAPCSGEGMFRKNDSALTEWSVANVKNCAERQAEILDCAAAMLKMGGTIVYSTCTFAPEEDEESVNNFVARHPEFKLVKILRLWPHKVKGEGHFAAVLYKGEIAANEGNDGPENIPEGKGDGGSENIPKGKGGGSSVNIPSIMSKGDAKKIREYLEDIVCESCFEPGGILGSGRLENYGDSIYLVPSEMISISGLKVLRPGLCIGTLNKGRFEPAHSLALAINPADCLRTVNLDVRGAADYIKGLTRNVEGEKGWTLVCVNGFSLAWGKNAGGILKNHYPKGLRKG